MGALEQIKRMKSQGKTNDEIVNSLQEQGISPKAINDALNQSKIKDAVSGPSNQDGMEPSIMENQNTNVTGTKVSPKTKEVGESENEDYYVPKPQSQSEQQNYSGQDYGNQGYSPQPQYTSQEYLPQEGYGTNYGGYGGYDTDTMIEIAEQVFSEKTRKIQKQIDEFSEFKSLAETKINHAEERLKRIESSIDKLQMAILEKVGSYGRGLDSIKKEMRMMQDVFSKTLPEIAKGSHSHKSGTHTTHTSKSKTHSKKKK